MKEKGKENEKVVKEPKVKKKKPVEKSRGWEKERREKLNKGFNELCKLLPDHDPSVTLSKMEILTKAAEYIRHLQEQNDDIIKCGNKTSLKNEADRLKKRVAFLLLKTKELVSALRVAGVPIPSNKKKKKTPKKQSENPNPGVKASEKPNESSLKKACVKSVQKTVCKTTSVSITTNTIPVIANANIVMSSPIVKPVVATSLQPIGIDKKVFSRLGPGTLILADGRVVNVPQVVPQIVVKPQPVLVMQRVKKESLIAPKKRDVTKTTFANKAPIPAIKAFRMESRPRSPKPKKKAKVVKETEKTKEVLVSATAVTTTTTTTTTTSTTIISLEADAEKVPAQEPPKEKVSESTESEEKEKTQTIVKYTIDALFSKKADCDKNPKETEKQKTLEERTLTEETLNFNEINYPKAAEVSVPDDSPTTSCNFFTSASTEPSISQPITSISEDFGKKYPDKEAKKDKFFTDEVFSQNRTQMFPNQNFFNENATCSNSKTRSDLFSHDLTSQNILPYQQNNEIFSHATNNSLIKPLNNQNFQFNQNQIFAQNQKVSLYPQTFPVLSQDNSQLNKFIPTSIPNSQIDNFSMSNITQRSQEKVYNKFVPVSNSNLNCDNFNMTNFPHKLPVSSVQSCDNFSLRSVSNSTQTNLNQKQMSCDNFMNQRRNQMFSNKHDNFSMNITHRSQEITQNCNNFQNKCNQMEPSIDFNQKTNEKNKDKLYSTNTEGNSFKTDGVCSNDLLRISKEIERNPFLPIDDRLGSDFSNDLFSSLQVPTGGHSESISPTAAFLLAFPLVSTSKNVDNLNESENHENQTSTPTTILQIGNIDTPNTEMFQPIEFGKEINPDYLDVQMKCKRKEPVKKKNYQNYYPNAPEFNQYENWDKKQERKKPDKKYYEYYKNEKKKKSKISVHWMTTPETEYPREEFLSTSSQYNMEIDNIPDLYTSKKSTWSPNKSLNPLENSLMIPTSTLPTLVGDLALGTTTPSDYKRYEKKTPEKAEEKRLQPKSQANFLSVSQLVDPKSKKLKPPERQYKKQEKKRNVPYPKRKEAQDPCMFNDNFVPNFNWDKRYKGNYSAESLIATQDVNETFNYQQNNYFQNTEFIHDPSGQSSQYQNCFNFPQNHFSTFAPEEYPAENFGINNNGARAAQGVEKRPDGRYREEGIQNNFFQNYYPSSAGPATTSGVTSQTNFNLTASMPSNFGITTNTTTSLTNFNLSTIFPEMNDQRSATTVQGGHGHNMNSFPNQNYRSHPPI